MYSLGGFGGVNPHPPPWAVQDSSLWGRHRHLAHSPPLFSCLKKEGKEVKREAEYGEGGAGPYY